MNVRKQSYLCCSFNVSTEIERKSQTVKKKEELAVEAPGATAVGSIGIIIMIIEITLLILIDGHTLLKHMRMFYRNITSRCRSEEEPREASYKKCDVNSVTSNRGDSCNLKASVNETGAVTPSGHHYSQVPNDSQYNEGDVV